MIEAFLNIDKFYIVIAVVLFIALKYIKMVKTTKEKYLKLEYDRLDLNIKLDLEFTDILDKLIMDTFNEYKLLNLAYDDTFINKDKEEHIYKDMTDLVSARLSNTFIKQLGLYYNPSIISDIIGKKIYLIVMQYVIEHNQTK